jgi:hypothetical protein
MYSYPRIEVCGLGVIEVRGLEVTMSASQTSYFTRMFRGTANWQVACVYFA